MNRDQKAAVIDEITAEIKESEAVFAVDYRGITVAQVATLRGKLREADASFRVVKNTLTERAADAADRPDLKELLTGPTALTFVRGDIALAAKALADEQKATELLEFKGGLMGGERVDADQIKAIAKLPSREVLYGQLVGVVASPITGVVRGLNALIQGVAIQLGGVLEKKQSGEIPAGDPPAAAATEAAPAAEAEAAPVEDAPAAAEGDQDAEAPEKAVSSEAPAEGADTTTDQNDNQTDGSADDAADAADA